MAYPKDRMLLVSELKRVHAEEKRSYMRTYVSHTRTTGASLHTTRAEQKTWFRYCMLNTYMHTIYSTSKSQNLFLGDDSKSQSLYEMCDITPPPFLL